MRTALGLRDGGCRFPGCDRPLEWTDGHHIRHWADGGETSLDNLVSLCRRHHRAVHEEGWQITLGRDRKIVVTEPCGRSPNGSR
jgi:predicted restriction endonuclease